MKEWIKKWWWILYNTSKKSSKKRKRRRLECAGGAIQLIFENTVENNTKHYNCLGDQPMSVMSPVFTSIVTVALIYILDITEESQLLGDQVKKEVENG